MAKVSIVLPTYNGSRYLRESVDSCLGQTYPSVELIVVDDGSSDETPTILRSYQDSRMIVVRHETNRGLPAALNTGFAHTSGEYLTWSSDDNYYRPEALEILVRYLEDHPTIDFVYSRCWLINEQGEIIGQRRAGPPTELKEYNCVGGCFLYRRKVYQAIGDYNIRMMLSEDYDYWVRVMQRFRMAFVDMPLYYYRQHDQSLTVKDYGGYRAQRLSLRTRRRSFGIPLRSYSRQRAYSYISEAFDGYRQHDMANVRRAVVLGLLHDWGWFRNRGVLSILARAYVGERIASLLRRAIALSPWRTRPTIDEKAE